MTAAPPANVLAAFGVRGHPRPLAGGQGTSWVAGELVLKPFEEGTMSEGELLWQARLFDSIECDGFRVARFRAARDGSYVVEGWTARQLLEGRHEEGRWADVIRVGERFHAALADVPRPASIATRTDRWAIGDRAAWGELPIEDFFHVKHVRRLAAALRPVAARSQLVHGDLTGNVLFSERLPPAVIDFAPYWRPVEWASAVVVGDALLWEGADDSLLEAVAHIEDFGQYLVRALIYRAVVDRLFRADEPMRPDEDDFFLAPVDLACRLVEAGR